MDDDDDDDVDVGGVVVRVHGGFIPRNHAGRLNKECPDASSKRAFFDEMSTCRGYLPKEGDAMRGALFAADDGDGGGSSSSYRLRGSREHRMLVESLMSGADLYSPPGTEEEEEAGEEEGGVTAEESSSDSSSPMSRLYQAQLLKDHAMGYRIASLMLEHHRRSSSSSSSSSSSRRRHDDRYVVVAGYGHTKHRLGAPSCAEGYLRAEAVHHPDGCMRESAMDVLLGISRPIPREGATWRRRGRGVETCGGGGVGTATIGCQMLYEAYLEESYPPMMMADDAVSSAIAGDDDDDDDAKANARRKALKDLYLRRPDILDEHILMSKEVSGPLLRYADGVAGFEHPCADYLYVYDEDDDNIIDEAEYHPAVGAAEEGKPVCPLHSVAENSDGDDAKDETTQAYERVGRTAGLRGNVARARAIMSRIGYTAEDMDYVGDDDIYNYQGVACPHAVAGIRRGEAVLDVGSGLGVDSFLAMRDCGADGEGLDNGALSAPFVVGIDLAESEVKHATKRAKERGYDVPRRIRFVRGDVEKIEEAFSSVGDIMPAMGMFDVCISNGAFCLVPDKHGAFGSVYRALKPGGRMAISTTTIVSDGLDPSFEWPVCMRMFAPLESILPMCERIGFVNVRIIDSESPMEGTEVPMDEVDTDNSRRFKIHGVYTDQYEFLQKMDMDELCKVVTVYGEKP